MAQLPPKVPAIAPNWPPSFPPHQRMPPLTTVAPPPAAHQPSWVDDFLEFSAARRGSHRRSVSDSVAFLEVPFPADDECRSGFDRLDDEQLMSMFPDDLGGGGRAEPTPGMSSPSDRGSDDTEQQQAAAAIVSKVEPAEDDSSGEAKDPPQQQLNSNSTTLVDPKRVKRILSNRQSAQRSRVRKLQYISELERSVTTLQTEVSELSPRVAYLDYQRWTLNVDNSALKERIAALAQDKIFKDAHQEALKKEIERLRQIYDEQNKKKMGNKYYNNNNCNNTTNPTGEVQPASNNIH